MSDQILKNHKILRSFEKLRLKRALKLFNNAVLFLEIKSRQQSLPATIRWLTYISHNKQRVFQILFQVILFEGIRLPQFFDA